jgi:hypothetical protein
LLEIEMPYAELLASYSVAVGEAGGLLPAGFLLMGCNHKVQSETLRGGTSFLAGDLSHIVYVTRQMRHAFPP